MGEVITKFKLETDQYDSKLRDATDRMRDLMRAVQVAGGSMNDLSAKDKELAKSFGTLSTGANNAKDKVRELANDLNKVGRAYFAMSKEMQQSDVGKAIAEQMKVMKDRLTEAKKELYEMGGAEKVAAAEGIDFNAVLQTLGGQFGINTKLLSGLTAGTLATTAAVTAGITAVVAATKAWVDYNDELNRQNNITTVTTGLKGDDAENLTIGVRALAKTYDVDFREAVNAANTLIQQFGVSGTEALRLLEDGMQGMIAGDGGKLLQMIQQYAPSFRDAGISASQLVAIIQNSEGGLFTDQNMNAIVMGIRNIRHQTKATQEALAGLGIDGEEMARKLDEGSMTVFEALQEVAGAIDNVGSGSDAAGAIMQNVFGRQGTMAGTKLGEAIATLNTNLEETKTQTGELGESFDKLNDANRRLESTMAELFGMSDAGWTDMRNFLMTDLANTLSDILGYFNKMRDGLKDIGMSDAFANLTTAAAAFAPLLSVIVSEIGMFVSGLEKVKEKYDELMGNEPTAPAPSQPSKQPAQNGYQVVTDQNGKVIREGKLVNGQFVPNLPEVVVTASKPTKQPKGSGGGRATKTTSAPKTETQLNNERITALVAEYQKLATAAKTADETQKVGISDRMNVAKAEIGQLQERNKELKRFAEEAQTIEYPVGSLPQLTQQLKELQTAQSQSLDAEQWQSYQRQIEETQHQIDKLKGKEQELGESISITTAAGMKQYMGVLGKRMEITDIGSSEYKDLQRQMADMKTLQSLVGQAMKVGLGTAMFDVADGEGADFWTRAMIGDVENADWQAIADIINEKRKEMGLGAIGIDYESGDVSDKKQGDTMEKSQKLVGALSQVSGGLQQMGIKLPDGVNKVLGGIQGLMAVIQGVTNVIQLFSAGSQTANTVAVTANTATMAALITALNINSATSLFGLSSGGTILGGGRVLRAASGTTVPGNFGFDAVPALLTSGETVLNKAQTNNIAALLEDTGRDQSAASATPFVRGEDIWLGVNNYLRRNGKGEIVTSRKA